MTAQVRRGLQVASGLLQRQIDVGEQTEQEELDWLATIEWIDQQVALDGRRRKPPGKYSRRLGEA